MPRKPRVLRTPRIAKHRTIAEAARPSPCKRGYDRHWLKVRAIKLSRDPLCEQCEKQGRVQPAVDVDHIVPIARGGAMYDVLNLQSLCKPCHSRKTALEDGGFGRPTQCSS